MTYTIKDILHAEVAPALGCTEPVAVALCTAAAAGLLKEDKIESIEVWVDANIYKNGFAVTIPGTAGISGLDMAAAIGAMGGDPKLRLEVLEPITQAAIDKALTLRDAGAVAINLLHDRKGIYVKGLVKGPSEMAECVIEDLHDNITALSHNGQPIDDSPLLSKPNAGGDKTDSRAIEKWLQGLTLAQILKLLDALDDDDLRFLQEGIDHNDRLAAYGLKHGSGLGIGRCLERLTRMRLLNKDMITAAKILTSAASDARMDGVKLPAMSSAGSGNHGLTATLPIWAVREYVQCDRRMVLEAVALSHVITSYVKAHTGRLSAVCGCSVAAGAGATAGITYLLGGDLQHIAGAIKNLIEDLAGVICDGAKAGCSLKLTTAAGTAVQAALFSLQGVQVQPTDGIIATSPEKTMQNIGALSTQGMIQTDHTILKIMLDKQFSVE